MRVLITGAHGMLGRDLQAVLADTPHSVTAAGRDDLDITDRAAADRLVPGHHWVINCAAYTAVDDAETDRDTARAINATGAGHLASAARAAGARIVQISTDYVFDGNATRPYSEDAPVNPLSVYGATKAEGEKLVRAASPDAIVLRTAWLYGEHGPNFVSAILDASRTRDTVSVLTDQRGQPTWTRDLAQRILSIIEHDLTGGAYHATNAGDASRFEFAQEIYRLAGLDTRRVTPAEAGEQQRPAPRPGYSVLGHEAWKRTRLTPLRPWRAALEEASTTSLFAAPDW